MRFRFEILGTTLHRSRIERNSRLCQQAEEGGKGSKNERRGEFVLVSPDKLCISQTPTMSSNVVFCECFLRSCRESTAARDAVLDASAVLEATVSSGGLETFFCKRRKSAHIKCSVSLFTISRGLPCLSQVLICVVWISQGAKF